jgi:hypothetical protein
LKAAREQAELAAKEAAFEAAQKSNKSAANLFSKNDLVEVSQKSIKNNKPSTACLGINFPKVD